MQYLVLFVQKSTYTAHAQPSRHMVVTALYQIDLVPTGVNYDHHANFILGSLVVCISQP